MTNLNTPARKWLRETFEFEYCAECGGDAKHHTAVPFMGNWFARCDFPPDDTSDLPAYTGPLSGDPRLHPTIRAFHCAEA